MFAALKALFTAFGTLFQAADTVARTVNGAATFAEEEMEALNEKARLERGQRMKAIRNQYDIQDVHAQTALLQAKTSAAIDHQ